MNRSDFRFLDTQRVRWAEVDMQKIVFNGHYLMYVDTAVAGWWRAMALPYEAAMHALGGDLYVRKATLEYLGSARYDDRLATGIRCARIGTSSVLLQAAVFRDETLLVHGELVYVFADPATQTSKPVPARLRALFEGFEKGEPTLSVRTGRWSEMGDAVMALRRCTAMLDGDSADASALHAVAVNGLGHDVGCARLPGGHAEADAVRVIGPLRGAGIGKALRQALSVV
jgi:YbgC/YbaW family acyl-CoA thioester hydrolase